MKYIIASSIFLCCSFFSFGQVSIKPKAGVNITRMERPKADFWWQDNQVSKVRLHAGVALEFPVYNKITLQAEVLYTQKGLEDTSHISSMFLNGNPYYKGYGYRLHYMELPVLFRVPFVNGIRLGVGPSISYLLAANYMLEGKKVRDMGASFSKLDYGLIGDLSYQFKNVEIGARYNYSLGTVKFVGEYDPEFDTGGNKPLGKNRAFQFYLGYVIK